MLPGAVAVGRVGAGLVPSRNTGVVELLELVVTVLLAVGTALLQVIMKGSSRPNLPGKNHALTQDDALFWTDWTVAASLALGGSLLVASSQDKDIPPTQVAIGFGAIIVGCVFFPFFLRTFAYDAHGKIKSWGWIFGANAVGILILLGAVAAGVRVYDWH